MTYVTGDLLPAYSDSVLTATLVGAKDPDHLVRASAMSNLADICKLLHFSLANVLQEVCIVAFTKATLDGSIRPWKLMLHHAVTFEEYKYMYSFEIDIFSSTFWPYMWNIYLFIESLPTKFPERF